MSRLIESIRLCEGEFSRLDLHQNRINRAFYELFKVSQPINLESILDKSDFPKTGLYKCRVIYDSTSFNIEFEPYQLRTLATLKLVEDNSLSYQHKFEDRSRINALYNLREACDDILIVQHGLITDASFANIVFQKNNRWFTPDTPLLHGTMRQFLLDSGVISVTSIRKSNLKDYEHFKLINSMMEWNAPVNKISQIIM